MNILLGGRQQVGPLDIWSLKYEPKQFHVTRNLRIASENLLKFSECQPAIVNTITALNNNNHPIFLQEGLIVEGLRQTRMIARDVVINPQEVSRIRVVCVEEGRWGDEFEGDLIHRAPVTVIAALRSESALGETADASSQERVWNSVSKHQSRSNSLHTTSLAHMTKSYNSTKSYLPFVAPSKYERERDQCGVVVGVNGEPILLELFGNPRMLKEHLPSIIQSVLWDLDDFDVMSTDNKSLFGFLEEALLQMETLTPIENMRFINGVSVSMTHDTESNSVLHAVALNHKHSILI